MENNRFLELGNTIDSYLALKKDVTIRITWGCNKYSFGIVNKGVSEKIKDIKNNQKISEFYQSLYDWVLMKYSNELEFIYTHSMSGEYTYHFIINDKIMLSIYGGFGEGDDWIYNRIKKDQKSKIIEIK